MLVLLASSCAGAGVPLVISQVLPSSYVEVFNAGRETISLEGLSLQTAAAGRPWDAKPMHGDLAPGQHYSVSPNPDTFNAYEGAVAVIRQAEPSKSTWPGSDQTIDLFAYAAQGYFGLDTAFSGRPFHGSAGVAYFRKNNGCQNSGDNADDFYSAVPQPRDLSSPATPCPASSRAPLLAANGIRHAATFQSGPLAPGTLIVVDGSGFSSGHTQLMFGPVVSRPYSVTANRILVTVPSNAPVGPNVEVAVVVDGVASATHVVSIAATAPGIFGRVSSGLPVGPPQNEDGNRNTPGTAASPGSTISFSCTGLGAEVATVAGAANRAAHGRSAHQLVSTSIGGRSAEISALVADNSFGGGVYRVTVVLPIGLSGGVQRLLLTVNGVTSPAEYLYLPELPANMDWGRIAAGARDLAYDPFRNLVYAGTADGQQRPSGAVPSFPNSILVIDQRLRSVTEVIPCGNSPYRLAVSARGKYLWLVLDHDQGIQRINLETRKVEFTVSFGEIFGDYPGIGVDRHVIQVVDVQPDASDDELLLVAPAGAPLFALRGNQRCMRMGPKTASLVRNPDGTLWTEGYRIRSGADGPEVLEAQSGGESILKLVAAIGDTVIDDQGVIRRVKDLRRTGLLNASLLSGGKNVVFRAETGKVYLGGGRFGYSLAAYDPTRLTMSDF